MPPLPPVRALVTDNLEFPVQTVELAYRRNGGESTRRGPASR